MIEMAFVIMMRMMKLLMRIAMKLIMRPIIMGYGEVTKIYVCWLV